VEGVVEVIRAHGLMQVVIPAAGVGRRFLPVTRAVPKELLPVGVLPLLHHALLEAQAAGFDRAVIVTSPEKRALRTYFEPDPILERRLEASGDLPALERLRSAVAIATCLRLSFAEQTEPTGLGDAVLKGAPTDEPFGVLLPDDLIPTPGHWERLRKLHMRTGASALYVRRVPKEQVHRFGIAECSFANDALRILRVVEKPRPNETSSDLAIFGRYVLTPEVVRAFTGCRPDLRSELQLTDGLAALAKSPQGVWAMEFGDDFYDCGTPGEYARSVCRWVSQHAT
jgi:UTP--glucose-1-phosphate uridylyltransferase